MIVCSLAKLGDGFFTDASKQIRLIAQEVMSKFFLQHQTGGQTLQHKVQTFGLTSCFPISIFQALVYHNVN